jgi:hypothetical protein
MIDKRNISMANKTKPAGVTIEDLLSKTKSSENPVIYSNHVQIALSNVELFLDFFSMGPSLTDPTKPMITHMQRVILPVQLGKGLATIIANAVAAFEEANNITLPTSREPDPNDKIKIWP